MSDEAGYQIDLDEEKILFEDQWVGRKELAERIRKMIESKDYRISAAGAALEFLETSISGARSLKVKLSGRDAEAVARHADQSGIPVSKFLRQAIQAYLAAQPPLQEEAGGPPSPEAAEARADSASGEPPSPEASEVREASEVGEAKAQPEMPPGLVPLGPAQPADGTADQEAGESEAQPQGEAPPLPEARGASEARGGDGGQVGGPVLTTITTEPAGPEEASGAVELTSKKSVESSKVVVDPSLSSEEQPNPNTIGDSWFKKNQ